MNPKSVILIQARMSSTRLPGKALAPIEGKPLITHLIERLRTVQVAAPIIVCTSTHPDDHVLTEIADQEGVKSFTGSEDDVLDRFVQAARDESADLVVRVTGDNPLTDPEAIDAMVRLHCQAGANYTYTEDLPRGTRSEVISAAALYRADELTKNPTHREHLTLCFREHPEVFNRVRWEAPESLRRPRYRLTVDTPEDLDVVQRVYKALYRGGEVFPLRETVRLLDAHPEWTAINAHITPQVPTGIGK